MTVSEQIEITMLLVASFYNTRWQEIRHSEMAVYILTQAIPKRTVSDTIHLPLPLINELIKVWNDKYSHVDYYQRNARSILAMIETELTIQAA